MIRVLELVHCVEAGFGVGVRDKRRTKRRARKPMYQKQVRSLNVRPCSVI